MPVSLCGQGNWHDQMTVLRRLPHLCPSIREEEKKQRVSPYDSGDSFLSLRLTALIRPAEASEYIWSAIHIYDAHPFHTAMNEGSQGRPKGAHRFDWYLGTEGAPGHSLPEVVNCARSMPHQHHLELKWIEEGRIICYRHDV